MKCALQINGFSGPRPLVWSSRRVWGRDSDREYQCDYFFHGRLGSWLKLLLTCCPQKSFSVPLVENPSPLTN